MQFNMKKLFSCLVLASCVLLAATACKPASTDNAAAVPHPTQTPQKHTIIYASTIDIRDINPHLYLGEMAAQNMVFESLVINTNDGVKPHLAQSWEMSPDGTTYTFHLREDVTFTDGEKFNAQAVKLNFDAILANAARHAWLEMVNQIESVEVMDEYTIQIHLKNAYYPILVELGLTRPFRFISPRDFRNGGTKDGVNAYHGTGPWVLAAHEKNQYALFTVNEQYWGVKPHVSSVRWQVMPDPQTILLALEKGDVDIVFETDGLVMIDTDTYASISGERKYTTQMSQPLASRALVLNTTRPILQDRMVRQALEHAIDKNAIAHGIFDGTEVVAPTLLSRTTPYCDVDVTTYELDINKANQLLDDAGWHWPAGATYREKNGETLRLVLSFINKNAIERTLSQAIQADLKKIGVELVISGEEKQVFLDRQRAGDFDIQYVVSWGTPYDPQSYVSSFRVPAHADYHAQLGLPQKAQLDEWVSTLLITPDDTLRQTLYQQVLSTLADEAVYIPLTYSRIKAVYRHDLQGVTFNPSQYEIPFEQMHF